MAWCWTLLTWKSWIPSCNSQPRRVSAGSSFCRTSATGPRLCRRKRSFGIPIDFITTSSSPPGEALSINSTRMHLASGKPSWKVADGRELGMGDQGREIERPGARSTMRPRVQQSFGSTESEFRETDHRDIRKEGRSMSILLCCFQKRNWHQFSLSI